MNDKAPLSAPDHKDMERLEDAISKLWEMAEACGMQGDAEDIEHLIHSQRFYASSLESDLARCREALERIANGHECRQDNGLTLTYTLSTSEAEDIAKKALSSLKTPSPSTDE